MRSHRINAALQQKGLRNALEQSMHRIATAAASTSGHGRFESLTTGTSESASRA
jgi:hypothetical protein